MNRLTFRKSKPLKYWSRNVSHVYFLLLDGKRAKKTFIEARRIDAPEETYLYFMCVNDQFIHNKNNYNCLFWFDLDIAKRELVKFFNEQTHL